MTSIQSLADQIAERVIGPLLSGASVRPVASIGSRRAFALANEEPVAGGQIGLEIAAARLRAARKLLPLDSLPELSPGEWLLASALNDLLQSTNPTLGRLWGHRRRRRLLEMATAMIERAGAPTTLGEALARYCTFGGCDQLVREDTHLSWWSGSRSFPGTRPPRRLLFWPRLRRVRMQRDAVPLSEMAAPASSEQYAEVLAAWVGASPLSDLASLARQTPEFRWTGASLALLSVPPGRTLAQRVIERSTSQARAAAVMRRAAERLPGDHGEARRSALSFADELEQCRWSEPVGPFGAVA